MKQKRPTMNKVIAVILAAIASVSVTGCLSGSAPAASRKNCRELGWTCGIDDYGNACGSCVGAQVCTGGLCVGDSGCSLHAYDPCSLTSTDPRACCAPMPGGTPTSCTVGYAGETYCAPRCTYSQDCGGLRSCVQRRDGIHVCTSQ